METRATDLSMREKSHGAYKNLYKLTVVGGVAFWAANFAISLTPIAAEYRAALSISYLPMIVEALIGGLIIGFFVSYFLFRFFEKIPTKNPILKSTILSSFALVLAIIMVGGSTSLLEPSDAVRYFLIGALLNIPRFLCLGIAIGYVYKRLNEAV
jgi:hypothetical protein